MEDREACGFQGAFFWGGGWRWGMVICSFVDLFFVVMRQMRACINADGKGSNREGEIEIK